MNYWKYYTEGILKVIALREGHVKGDEAADPPLHCRKQQNAWNLSKVPEQAIFQFLELDSSNSNNKLCTGVNRGTLGYELGGWGSEYWKDTAHMHAHATWASSFKPGLWPHNKITVAKLKVDGTEMNLAELFKCWDQTWIAATSISGIANTLKLIMIFLPSRRSKQGLLKRTRKH